MKLSTLLNGIEFENNINLENIEIENIVNDSRKANEKSLFIAYSGYASDVHPFIEKAYENGCKNFVVLKGKINNKNLHNANFIYVKDIRKAFSIIAKNFYGDVTSQMKIIGITGTSGKTTTTFVIYNALRWLGKNVGLIGTIEYRINDEVFESTNTTPDLLDLYEIITKMKKEGVEYLVMEVSSHSLALGRVDGINFDVCGFTNFSQDHLDFHKTMEEYLEAKLLIFDKLNSSNKKEKTLIVNKDMEIFTRIKKKALSYPLIKLKTISSEDDKADYFIRVIKNSTSKTVFELNGEKIEIKMPGITNVYNFAFASSILHSLGFKITDFSTILIYTSVKGRMESIPNHLGISIIVDYAHKPDALEKVLKTLRPIIKNNGKLITVFGCGGDRDRLKRPIMGKIAGELSDYVIITSDNPRTEDPLSIIKEIEEGIKNLTTSYEIIPDRREAIRKAIFMANKNDCILIAGKGHEDYQIIGKEKFHFSDKEEAIKAIKEKQKNEIPEIALKNLRDSIHFSINYSEKLENELILENIIQILLDIYFLKYQEHLHRSVVEFLMEFQDIFSLLDIKLISQIEKGLRTKKDFFKLVESIQTNKLKNILSKIKTLLRRIEDEINNCDQK